MDLTELETFNAVVEAGSVSAAALRLHRAQSSITVRIRQLEASLGVSLFQRQGRGLRLTAAGERLLGYSGRVLRLADEARDAVRNDKLCGRLRLGAMESVAAARLPQPLAGFHRDHPEVAVELRIATSRELLAQLQAGSLDAAVVGGPVDARDFVHVRLYDDELLLVSAAEYPALRTAQPLSGATLLVFRDGCTYRGRLNAWLESARVVPGRVLEFASYYAILASVAAGVGVSMVPRSVLEIYPQRAALALHPVPPRIAHLSTWLVSPRSVQLPALAALREVLCADAAATKLRPAANATRTKRR